MSRGITDIFVENYDFYISSKIRRSALCILYKIGQLYQSEAAGESSLRSCIIRRFYGNGDRMFTQ